MLIASREIESRYELVSPLPAIQTDERKKRWPRTGNYGAECPLTVATSDSACS